MYKSYHKKIVTATLLTSVLFLGTACNADNEKKAATATPAVKAEVANAKLDTTGFTKREIDAVGPANALVSDTVKKTYGHNGKLAVDGGVIYPIVNGKTGAYYANEKAHSTPFNKGKTATENEQKAWDIDVMPDGTGLPEGSGSVEDGDAIYEEKCLSCHGDFGGGSGLYPRLTAGNAVEMQKTLMHQRVHPDDDGPHRVFGSNWPYASTLWWYIKTGMPHQAPMSLTTDEVYALSAYILNINEMSIDGVEVDDEYVLDREKFLKIVMPNVDGFEPKINGPKGQDNARAYFNNPLNYGNGVKCMKDCFEGEPKVQSILIEMKDFHPPLSNVKDLPKEDPNAAPVTAGQKTYEAACALCHSTDSMGAPETGNKDAWAKVLEQGIETVYDHAINGFNGMPAKGGQTSLSDEVVKEAVDYILEKSK